MNTKQITLEPYDPRWPEIFAFEADQIRKTLTDHVIDIHHIGSTSVPGLAAKRDIDICLVIDHLQNSLTLQNIGYTFKGELNIPMRTFFSKNSDLSKVNLHVVEAGHHFIALNLCFRDHLRANDSIRIAYQELKMRLAHDPINFERIAGRFPRYTLEKHDFINGVLDAAGYNALGVVRCTHYREWEAYHQIRTQHAECDKNDPTLSDPDHYHFVLLHGTTIVAAAHVEWTNANEACIQSIPTDKAVQSNGYEDYLRGFLERWIIYHEKKRVII
jgi:GrpB-like predicted nucleotidyltransferase (UPF0157 family)